MIFFIYLPFRQTVWALPERLLLVHHWIGGNFYDDSAPTRAIIINLILIRREELWSHHYEKTLTSYSLCRWLQAGRQEEEEKHLIIINKTLTHCCLCGAARYGRTQGFYRVREHCGIKIKLLHSGTGFLWPNPGKPRTIGHTEEAVGVIRPRHSAGDCQMQSHLPLTPPTSPAVSWILSPGPRCTYRRK